MGKVSRSLARGKLATRSALLAPFGPGFIKPGWRWAGCAKVIGAVQSLHFLLMYDAAAHAKDKQYCKNLHICNDCRASLAAEMLKFLGKKINPSM